MKDKIKVIKRTVIAVGILFLGAAVSFGIYYLADHVWNGMVLDWFTRNYMNSVMNYDDVAGDHYYYWEPDWPKLKALLLEIFCVSAVVWLAIVMVVSRLRARYQMKRTVSRISNFMHDYMSGEQEASEVFPAEYAEISVQMSEVKSTMQRNEQILKEEAGRKNDLIAYLAHDLKTPLTSVIGYLSLLDEIPEMPLQQRAKYVKITLDKAQRLEKLINEFFEITRYNLQQITLEKETVDLNYMLIQMTDEFYPILNAHGNRTELNAPEELTVNADPVKLARVFNNILKNAVAYSYPDTVIRIGAGTDWQEVWISFTNEGQTIPKQKLDSIFEKFFRLDEARTTNTGGAGLGLAIAKEIVTLHGGTITAESEEGRTTFQVRLPWKG